MIWRDRNGVIHMSDGERAKQKESEFPICPECGSNVIEEQTRGYFKMDPPHDHNPNQRWCYGCGYKWYQPCPECGEVYDV